MLSHTGEKPFICKQCNYLFVYLHIRHPGTSFLRSSYNYIFKNIAYVIVYVWPSRTWDEILLPFQKGLFFPLGDIRLFLPTRIRICAYAHHPTWIRHGRIRMAIPNLYRYQNNKQNTKVAGKNTFWWIHSRNTLWQYFSKIFKSTFPNFFAKMYLEVFSEFFEAP